MSKKQKREVINSKIWQEEPELDNPFAARKCICSGYDVYGDLLGKISWIEYLYLLFKLEPPTESQAKLLEGIAIAIANPGPRDLSVRAAMNAGVGGSTAASYLMAALAPGAGQYGGAREVLLFFNMLVECGLDIENWQKRLTDYSKGEAVEVWPDIEHTPGFDPYGASCPLPIIQTLDYIAATGDWETVHWLKTHRDVLEISADGPLTIVALAAAVFHDLEFNADQAELLFLMLRLPGAAAHALEQKSKGPHRYPFFGAGLKLTNDPGPKVFE